MKKLIEKYYVEFLIFTIAVFSLQGDYWHSKWFFLLTILSIFIGYVVSIACNSKLAGATFAWCLFSGIAVFSFLDHPIYKEVLLTPFYGSYTNALPLIKRSNPNADYFYAESAYSTISLLMLGLFNVFIGGRVQLKIMKCFLFVANLSAIFIITHFLFGKTTSLSTGGLFDQGSMEGCFLAILYPFALHEKIPKDQSFRKTLFFCLNLLLTPIAIFILVWKAETSIPLGVLAGVLLMDFLVSFESLSWRKQEIKFSFANKITIVLSFLLPIFAIGYVLNPNLLNSSGRFPLYKIAWDFQSQHWALLLFGLGNGTWSGWAQALQAENNFFPGSNFSFMHSDWLQIFFEQGAIGFVLILGVGLLAFKRVIKYPCAWLGASLFGFGLTMLFNYPCHLAVHAFLGMFLLSVCLRE